MQKNILKNQTAGVMESLVNYIRDMGLRPGDRLPPQASLRRSLGVGSVTIQRAINSLKKAGVLDTIPHRGVFLRDTEVNGFSGRQIGLVLMWRTQAPFFNCLLQCTLLQFHISACQCKLFLRNFSEMTDYDRLSYFDGLRRCVEEHQIQGLMTSVSFDDEAWELFDKYQLPVVSLDTATHNSGHKILQDDILKRSFEQARQRGFKRPALIRCGYPITEQTMRLYKENSSLPPEQYCHIISPQLIAEDVSPDMPCCLEHILDTFLAMTPDQRPDVVLIPDDILTNMFQQSLLNRRIGGADWNPFLIYMVHRQIPIIHPRTIRGDYFEFDIMKYAETAVSFLLDLIRGKEEMPENIVVEPSLHLQE